MIEFLKSVEWEHPTIIVGIVTAAVALLVAIIKASAALIHRSRRSADQSPPSPQASCATATQSQTVNVGPDATDVGEIVRDIVRGDFADILQRNLRPIAAGLKEIRDTRVPTTESMPARPTEPILDTTDGQLHKEIDRAFEFTKQGHPEVTITLLREMRDRKWADCSERLRYRILANIGNALVDQGKFDEAANHYFEAIEHYLDDANAKCIHALAFLYRSDHVEAHRIASEVCADADSPPRAHAIRARTFPEGTPFKEIEGSIPREFGEDAEVAIALFERSRDAGLPEVAERYARIATKARPDWLVSCP